jgi:hypothetical protein
MALHIATASENRLLGWVLNSADTGDLSLGVYTSNITPGDSDTASTYTSAEASWTGYSRATLTRGSWTISQISSKASGTYAAQTFSVSSGSGATCYGIFVLDHSGNLIYAEKFASSVATSTTSSLSYTPVFTLSSES